MDFSAVASELSDKLVGWATSAILLSPNIVAALLSVVVFWLFARLARFLVTRALSTWSSYKAVNRLLGTTAYVAVLGAGIFVALGLLGLDKAVSSLLAGAGIVGLALAFAFQDIAANFMSGIFLSIRRPFREGDLIRTNTYFGNVVEINLRATHVITQQGQIAVLPNKDVFQSTILNYSTANRRRIDLTCGVAYGEDLERARQVALDAVEALEGRDTSRPVELFYDEFGESAVNFKLRIWIEFENKEAQFLSAQSEAIICVTRAFEEHGITIPSPIRTVNFAKHPGGLRSLWEGEQAPAAAGS